MASSCLRDAGLEKRDRACACVEGALGVTELGPEGLNDCGHGQPARLGHLAGDLVCIQEDSTPMCQHAAHGALCRCQCRPSVLPAQKTWKSGSQAQGFQQVVQKGLGSKDHAEKTGTGQKRPEGNIATLAQAAGKVSGQCLRWRRQRRPSGSRERVLASRTRRPVQQKA